MHDGLGSWCLDDGQQTMVRRRERGVEEENIRNTNVNHVNKIGFHQFHTDCTFNEKEFELLD